MASVLMLLIGIIAVICIEVEALLGNVVNYFASVFLLLSCFLLASITSENIKSLSKKDPKNMQFAIRRPRNAEIVG